MRSRKILLTNCELSVKARRQLLRALGKSFTIKNVDSTNESDLCRVEIMLMDIVKDSGKRWLEKDKLTLMPKLRLIQSIRAGVDAINFANIPEGVIICGNVGAYSESIAEFAAGMILYLAKDLGNRSAKLKLGIAANHDSVFLEGKTMGIIGVGGIGRAIAKIGKCFGMITVGINTSGQPVRYCDKTFASGNLNNVLKCSDVVILTLPLTVKTFHIIGRKELQLMKENCILVNLGRGHVIDESALFEHLERNPTFKCALDVWWHYPKKGEKFFQKYPFLKLPNFLGTPHVSGFVPAQYVRSLECAIRNVVSFVDHRRLSGQVDRSDYEGLHELVSAARTN